MILLAGCLAFWAVPIGAMDRSLPPRSSRPPVRMEFKLHSGMMFMALGDLNEGWRGVLEGRELSPRITMTSGRYRPARFGFEAGAEWIFFVGPGLGVGVEAGFLRTSRASETGFAYAEKVGPTYRYREHVIPTVTAVPLIFKIQKTLVERGRWTGAVQGGAGPWVGRACIEHSLDEDSGSFSSRETWRGSWITWGAQGGLSIDYRFGRRFALVLDVIGRYAKLRNARGNHIADGIPTPETFQWICYAGAFDTPSLIIDRAMPTDDYYRGYRKAAIDFSGFSVRLGLKMAVPR